MDCSECCDTTLGKTETDHGSVFLENQSTYTSKATSQSSKATSQSSKATRQSSKATSQSSKAMSQSSKATSQSVSLSENEPMSATLMQATPPVDSTNQCLPSSSVATNETAVFDQITASSQTTNQCTPPEITASEGAALDQSTPLSERTDQHTPPPYARSEAATLSHTMPPSTPAYEMTNQPTTPETANESEMLTQTTPPPETTNQSAPLSKAANEGATLSQTTPLSDATNQRPAPPLITSNEAASGSGLDSGVTTTTINTTTTTTINTTTTTTTITTNTTASAVGGGHHPRKVSRSLRSYLHAAQWSDSGRKKRGAKLTSRAQLRGVELPQHIWHLPSGFFQCMVCEGRGYCLQSLRGVRSHCEGRRHQTEAAKAQAQLLEEAPKLKVTTSGCYHRAFRAHSLTLPLTPEGPRQMTFTLTNVTSNTSLRFVKWHGPYFNGELRFLQPSANSATAPPALEGPEKLIIQPGRSIDLTLQITPQEETTLSFKAHFHLEDLGRKVDACKFAPVVENCPVRISVVGGAEAGGDTDGSGGK